ncbi:conjugative transposon protein TraN [Prevotella multiformis]|uniref:conjugative transposon protein TraN n=1 Tax=Prevotella multiformis TaxID=282402 RepID=UPI001BA43DD5|nr:conjugative transposon protein TraN [Prevotella multiformis]QUB71743.1 conjugative transposon protein TraN [Prevotella multiformis]
MKQFLVILVALMGLCGSLQAQKTYKNIEVDSVSVRYIRNARPTDSYIFDENRRKDVVFVNEKVTTHLLMPENIKLVDISTNKIVGNQCTDNIVRIKPSGRMYDNELVGTITVIGERHIVQLNVVYTAGSAKANFIYRIKAGNMGRYENPDVTMPRKEMAAYAWAIFASKPRKHIHSQENGIKAGVNNIYSIGDYFFIDYSLYNATKIKYDISEVRIKLADKKELKATNSQTIELTPVYSLSSAKSFKKAYRNVLVLDKLTFPEEKVLKLEISEEQISGRVITLDINYKDMLHADGVSEQMVSYLPVL